MNWKKEKVAVLDAAQRLVKKDLVIGTMGNVSVRLPVVDGKELIAITPSNRYYDTLTSGDIVIVDINGEVIEGKLKPSTEKMLHIAVYKQRGEINAVIHFHAIFSSILAVANLEIPPIIDDQIICLGGAIKVATYAYSGSPELDKNVIKALENNNVVMMANHGALSVGRDLRDAFTNCEMLEKTAQIYLNALKLGTVNKLSDEEVNYNRHLFDKIHGKDRG